jgi:hypothetical protein
MSKLVAVVLSLAVGFALARFAVPPALDVVDVNAVPTASTNIFASDQPLDERVRALEQAVSDERQARQPWLRRRRPATIHARRVARRTGAETHPKGDCSYC